MERRGFLRGLFGGIVGGGVIVAASDEEVARFASPLVADDPMVLEAPQIADVSCGDHLYNERGELVAIVTNIHIGGHYTITADGIGAFQYTDSRVRLRNPSGLDAPLPRPRRR